MKYLNNGRPYGMDDSITKNETYRYIEYTKTKQISLFIESDSHTLSKEI